MAVDDELMGRYADRFAPLGNVTTRKMFGGAGYWASGDMFALLDSDSTLYFKVDDDTRPRYEEAGATPFSPRVGGDRAPMTMPYFAVPAEVLADDDTFEAWARDAMAVAHASPKRDRKRRRRR